MKKKFLYKIMGEKKKKKELVEKDEKIDEKEKMEIECELIKKNDIEKEIKEIEKRILNEFELRKNERSEGRR
jgi:hypothetical protein